MITKYHAKYVSPLKSMVNRLAKKFKSLNINSLSFYTSRFTMLFKGDTKFLLGAALFGHEKYQLRCHFELPIGCLQASVIAYFLLLKVKLQIQLKIATAIQGT